MYSKVLGGVANPFSPSIRGEFRGGVKMYSFAEFGDAKVADRVGWTIPPDSTPARQGWTTPPRRGRGPPKNDVNPYSVTT